MPEDKYGNLIEDENTSSDEYSDDEVDAALKALKGDPDVQDTDTEAQDSGDSEASAAEGDEEGDEGKDSEPRIPKSRFDEQVNRERERAEAAEAALSEERRRIAELLGQQYQEETPSLEEQILETDELVNEARTVWMDAVAEGDKDAARKALSTLRDSENYLAELRNQQVQQSASSRATQDTRYDQTLEALEEEFPQISVNDPNFDRELAGKMVNLINGHVRGGMSRVEALLEANAVYLEPLRAAQASETRGNKEVSMQSAGKKGAAQAAAASAPDLNKVGVGRAGTSATLNVAKLNHKQFGKLSEDDKARLRGDELGSESS